MADTLGVDQSRWHHDEMRLYLLKWTKWHGVEHRISNDVIIWDKGPLLLKKTNKYIMYMIKGKTQTNKEKNAKQN